jgi:hypothetical protein
LACGEYSTITSTTLSALGSVACSVTADALELGPRDAVEPWAAVAVPGDAAAAGESVVPVEQRTKFGFSSLKTWVPSDEGKMDTVLPEGVVMCPDTLPPNEPKYAGNSSCPATCPLVNSAPSSAVVESTRIWTVSLSKRTAWMICPGLANQSGRTETAFERENRAPAFSEVTGEIVSKNSLVSGGRVTDAVGGGKGGGESAR